MPYAPTLTPYIDESPCPRVEVFFEELHPDTATVTVLRSAGGREYQVRGAVRAVTAGTLSRIDFECPLNIPVTYRAEMFDDAGFSLGFTDPTLLGDVVAGLAPGESLAPDDDLPPGAWVVGTGLISDSTWLHNPLNPQGAVKVKALASTAQELSRPVPVEWSRPRGRRFAVGLAEPRQGLAGLQFDVFAPDLEIADKIQELIGDYSTTSVPVICIRIGLQDEPMRIPRPLFFGTEDIIERDINVRFRKGWTAQAMVGDEAEPPTPGLFIPLLTAADINAFYAGSTAAQLNNDHARAVDVNRRYDLAGYALQ